MKVTKEKYSVAIAWLRDLIWGSEFSIERFVISLVHRRVRSLIPFRRRLKISATKALQNLPSEKRSGSTVAYNAYRELVNSLERCVTKLLRRIIRTDRFYAVSTPRQICCNELNSCLHLLLDSRTSLKSSPSSSRPSEQLVSVATSCIRATSSSFSRSHGSSSYANRRQGRHSLAFETVDAVAHSFRKV